jgi:NAD(P)-dependent dehydrogenase (short-subunit alcohol dehydrogenase family)
MVNNAGIYVPATLLETDRALFERHMRVNQLGCFLGMKAVVGAMERAGGGSIVNISSVAGLRANPGQSNYAAAKAGLMAFTRTVAVEVARRGITVNAVAPGLIDTEMTAGIPEELLAAVPARRIGTPEEVAACVRFLASDEASYVTGAVLTVDGGLAA